MSEDLMLLKTMPWKHRAVLICLSILSFVLCRVTYDSLILLVKGFLFLILLLVASYFDIRARIIPDWIHVLILIIGLIDFDLEKSIAGLIISPLPFLIMALIKEGSIGGGDVKLVGAMGFVLGIELELLIIFITLVFIIVYGLLKSLFTKEISCRLIPLVPFIGLAYLFSCIFNV